MGRISERKGRQTFYGVTCQARKDNFRCPLWKEEAKQIVGKEENRSRKKTKERKKLEQE